jgi:hypothetical protein
VGRKRINIESVASTSPRLSVNVKVLQEEPFVNDMTVRASVMEIYRIIKELVKLNPFFKEQLQSLIELTDVNKPNELADMAAALTTAEGGKLQAWRFPVRASCGSWSSQEPRAGNPGDAERAGPAAQDDAAAAQGAGPD